MTSINSIVHLPRNVAETISIFFSLACTRLKYKKLDATIENRAEHARTSEERQYADDGDFSLISAGLLRPI
jgi:hypothetical protein